MPKASPLRHKLWRGLVTACGLILLWQLLFWLNGERTYLLPSPWQTMLTWWHKSPLLISHASTTLTEILLGLLLGGVLGFCSALSLSAFRPLHRWLMPVLVISQAIPVFAIAPLLVLWLGYGMASKVAMATLIIYFPVTAAFLDGLRRTEPVWLEVAHTLQASRWQIIWQIKLPAALPALASGLRVAAAVAPIGAVVGEWVGSSHGLGYLMLHANARMQADVMFAALLTLSLLSLIIYFSLDALLRRLVPWSAENDRLNSTNRPLS